MTPRRRLPTVLVCPTHRDLELGRAGGEYHHPDTGWCTRCKKVVRGVRVRS